MLASSPLWLGACGFGIIVLPIMGIQFIHKEKKFLHLKIGSMLNVNLKKFKEYGALLDEIQKKVDYRPGVFL